MRNKLRCCETKPNYWLCEFTYAQPETKNRLNRRTEKNETPKMIESEFRLRIEWISDVKIGNQAILNS